MFKLRVRRQSRPNIASALPHEPSNKTTVGGGDVVNMRREEHLSHGGMSEDDELRLALDLLRDLADQEFRRTERSTSRGRQAVALAAGFFAVAQTVAFSASATTAISSSETEALVWLAGIAAVTLTAGAVLLLLSEKGRTIANLSPALITNELNRGEGADGSTPLESLVEFYSTFVEGFRADNNGRVKWIAAAQIMSGLSILVVLVELIYAFSTRV